MLLAAPAANVGDIGDDHHDDGPDDDRDLPPNQEACDGLDLGLESLGEPPQQGEPGADSGEEQWQDASPTGLHGATEDKDDVAAHEDRNQHPLGLAVLLLEPIDFSSVYMQQLSAMQAAEGNGTSNDDAASSDSPAGETPEAPVEGSDQTNS